MGCGASSGVASRDHSTHSEEKSQRGMSLVFWKRGNKSEFDDQNWQGEVRPVNLTRPPAPEIPKHHRTLLDEHARFLVNFVAILERSSGGDNDQRKAISRMTLKPIQRPEMDTFEVKSHWMDNVRARKMCDEMLHLEDTRHPLPAESNKASGIARNTAFMRTLQLGVGQTVNVLKMSNNPEVKIGGYFIISQMLSYIKGLVSLDLSANNLTAAEARVLSLGLKANHCVQELRMKENRIGSEGATSMADMLKINDTLLLMDLRDNRIRGAGVCVLADAVSENTSLTELDMRWNYAGECSDFVEMALVDLKKFCFRNMMHTLLPMVSTPERSATDQNNKAESGEVTAEKPNESVKMMHVPASLHYDDFLSDHEPIGRLEVTILSARNLPQVIWTAGKDGEFMGLPQAYCTFTLNKQTTSTAIMKKDWAPTWNHTVSIDVRQVWQVCSLRVMHSKTLHNTHVDDYTIGNVHVPVGQVINWRGVNLGADDTWRACYRPLQAKAGDIYQACRSMAKVGDSTGMTDIFETAEEAARAYDETALKKDNERAALNLSSEYDYVGQHVKDELYTLTGEDGISVIGVQAGVPSAVRLRLKFFSACCHYLEISLDKASSLPKMDTGLGTCDAYCIIYVGDYRFRTRVVRNSLDPAFRQTFRIAIQDADVRLDIKVSVWDWDKFNDDDHMGDAEMVVNPADSGSGKYNLSYEVKAPEGVPLTNSKKEVSKLHMRFAYTEAVHPDDHDHQE